MSQVEIYTTYTCPYCLAAKELLKRKGVEYSEINVAGDPVARSTMSQRANGRTSVPQIFIDGRHIGGCDDIYALEEAGELDPLLAT
ncbi:glutaredoxin 3 [Ancylobacter pratisalsi]|uniref:Glutaredoxin n=1 Tax=Ancylobacter pratisalsi TaxID=1745854 RepID=A0A6P1YKL1_9HYPH|nr:glutaredoxin 3 [Ancylobacter pratisalsi]QIB33246.1 glutaredoxin 3 [Ancylobacter pratisalsi]